MDNAENITRNGKESTVKTTGGWASKITGIKSWTSSCDGVYFVDDAGLEAAQTAFMNGTEVKLDFTNSSGLAYSGQAVITSMSVEAGQEDIVSYTISFEGTGALTAQ